MSSDYWKKRFIELEKAQNKISDEYLIVLKNEYNKSLAKIEKDIINWYTRIANNNQISYANAKKLLDKKELQEFKWTVEEYIEKGKENAINQNWLRELENASARVHIDKLNAIKIQIQNELEHLYNKQNKGVESLAKEHYQDNYYKSSYIIQNKLQKYWKIQALDKNKIQKVISKSWTTDNQTFSDRIWKNKDELINTLQKELVQATIKSDDLQGVIRKIEKDFEVSKNKASRLVMTESAFFSSAGQKECFINLNVKQYEIVATLDSHTSEICQELDGKVFDMKDYNVGITAPPFHCWCRSVTAPYFNDEFTQKEKRAYRNEKGQIKYVNSQMKYNEWKGKYVTNNKNGGIIKTQQKKKAIVKAKTFKIKLKEESLPTNIKEFYNYYKQKSNQILTPANLNKILGYDGKPKIVSKEEFYKISTHSKYGILERGFKTGKGTLTINEIIDNYKNGKFYVGEGIYGSGTYTAYGNNAHKVALSYAIKDRQFSYENNIVKYLLKEDTKVIKYKDLRKMRDEELNKFIKENGFKDYSDVIENGFKNIKTTEISQYILEMQDIGVYASVKGYDAIDTFTDNTHADEDKYIVILNRKKMIMHD